MPDKPSLRERPKRKVIATQPKQSFEDEETTDDEGSGEPTTSGQSKEKKSESTTRESTLQPSSSTMSGEENGEGNDDEEDESSDESIELPEPMVPNRPKRSTAGNKMKELLNSHSAADEFYENAYGGFKEDEVDENFTPPDETDEEEADEVDSDFDREENQEEEQQASDENDEEKQMRNRNKMLLKKNKKWVVARFDKVIVKENSVDAKTQEERLKEAKITAVENVESLKRFETMEVERRKRQAKPVARKKLEGPIIKTISKLSEDGKEAIQLVCVPDLKTFEKPQKKEFRTCAVTGRPAKYIDPITELPYADLEAFKKLRECYKGYLVEKDKGKTDNDMEIDWLERYQKFNKLQRHTEVPVV
ncbi:YL1 nuclear protein [Ditylenchus destructor]|nr:YL1 nuclear protein [Ditylenchus destructor]